MISHRKTVKYCWVTFLNRMSATSHIGDLELEGGNLVQWQMSTFSWTLLVLDCKAVKRPLLNREQVKSLYDKILLRIESYKDWSVLLDELEILKQRFTAGVLKPQEDFLIKDLSLKDINSVLTYQKTTHYKNDELLLDELEKWCDNEDTLKKLSLPKDLCLKAASLMSGWLKDLSFKDIIPHHGPGACAEFSRKMSTPLRKTSLVEIDAALNVALNSVFPERNSTYLNYQVQQKINRTSRLVYVPKSYKSLRAVNPEPATLMFFQQGVKDVLYRYIGKHPFLKHVLPLTRQEQNRELAQFGSFVDSFATIDLSSASDMVSWQIVKAIFKKTPLWKWIVATRSRSVEIKIGKEIFTVNNFNKYAPMGSALTFPIESLTFLAISIAAIQMYEEKLASPIAQGQLKNLVSIYGDDIIVPTQYFDVVTSALELCGFKVNIEKSFTTDSPFRESCGIEAIYGKDVTPLRSGRNTIFPSFSEKIVLKPAQLDMLISKVNLAYFNNYHLVRNFFLTILKNSYYRKGRDLKPILLSYSCDWADQDSIYSTNPPSPQFIRYNKRLQRREVKVTKIISKDISTSYCTIHEIHSHYLSYVFSRFGECAVFNSLIELERTRFIELKDHFVSPLPPNPVFADIWVPYDEIS